jgi:phage terminase large subunit
MGDPCDSYATILQRAWRSAVSASGEANDVARHTGNPVGFAETALGHQLWEAQEAILNGLERHRRVVVRSCRKSGKTFAAADAVLYFISTAPTVSITTAPTGRQVRELLWGRIRAAHARAPARLPGRTTTTALRVAEDWYALGISTDDPENFLGFHSGVLAPGETGRRSRLLFIFDEAPGVDPSIFDAMEGSMSGPDAYVLLLGNPLLDADDPHPFARACQPGSGWHRIHIGANEIDDDYPGADECFHEVPQWLLEPTWKEEREKEWGSTSSLYRAHVLGCFAGRGAAADLVIPRSLLEAAEAQASTSKQGRHIGVDVARTGSDEAVGALWVDGVKAASHAWSSPDLMETADIVIALTKRWGAGDEPVPGHNVHVDVIGIGAGVVDRLRQRGLMVDAVDFGASPNGEWTHLLGELRPKNRRAELHWAVRRAFQEGLGHLPRAYAESWREAQWARYEVRPGAQGSTLSIEPKDDIRARHGRSPDHWDADLLAWSRSSRKPLIGTMRRW